MARKKNVTNRFKVFGFMIPGSKIRIIAEDGRHVADIETGSIDEAKEKFISESVDKQIMDIVGVRDYMPIYVDDPAGDAAVIEACRIMEECGKSPVTPPVETESDAFVLPSPDAEGNITIDPTVVEFEGDTEGCWQPVTAGSLKVGDTIRILQGESLVSSSLFTVVREIETADNGNTFTIVLREKEEHATEKKAFKSLPETEVVEVVSDIPTCYKELVDAVTSMRNLELEANASAAEYRDSIKKMKQRVYDISIGKSRSHVKCRIVYKWSDGVKEFVNESTGEIVKTEDITDAERQTNLDNELAAATPTAPAPEPESAEQQQEIVVENVECVDVSEPGLEPTPDDFGEPPTEQGTGEAVEEA